MGAPGSDRDSESVVRGPRFARAAGRTNASAPTRSHFGTAGGLFLRLDHRNQLRIWQHSRMQFYRRNLPHLQKDFTPHFITFVTKFRWILPPAARDVVLASCLHDHRRRYELYAVVVMPDHAHMILTPLIDTERGEIFSLTRITQTIKSASARAINQKLIRTGAVWQEESFDHVLRVGRAGCEGGIRRAKSHTQRISHRLA